MTNEQASRFESMRQFAADAEAAIASLQEMTHEELKEVDHDSSRQAESLQRVQEFAGTAVDALKEIEALARRARSFQAQAHQSHSGDRPQ